MAKFTVFLYFRVYFLMNYRLFRLSVVEAGFNLLIGLPIENISPADISAAYLRKLIL